MAGDHGPRPGAEKGYHLRSPDHPRGFRQTRPLAFGFIPLVSAALALEGRWYVFALV